MSRMLALVIVVVAVLARLAYGWLSPDEPGAPSEVSQPEAAEAAAPAEAGTFTVHMSPAGADGNDGLTTATAVRSLARVHRVLTARKPKGDVEVRISPGTYVAPETEWTFYVPGHTISFMPIDYEVGEGREGFKELPVLQGDGSAGWWLSAQLPGRHRGGDTNLRFYYLQVEGYSTGGLNISGDYRTNSQGISAPSTAGANRNTIFGMVFQKLGSGHNPAGVGYGGVDLVNSSGNVIRNNHFIANENKGGDAGLMHGVYLAHGSKKNIISGNRFTGVSGDAVRTRNDSNDNDISGNTFERSGSAAYSEWFCDAACVAANPGRSRECASHGNFFHDNTIISTYGGDELLTWDLNPPGADLTGGDGCDNEGQKRVRTTGNGNG